MKNKDNYSYLASVIIPCYNSEKTIEKTLKSLKNQIFKCFEVIIINDGSIDNTDAIIKKWIDYGVLNISYYMIENSGVSVARNTGLLNAKGKYILFLDADDIYHSNYIDILVKIMECNEIETAFCSYSTNFEYINKLKSLKYKPKILCREKLMDCYLFNKVPCGLWSFIYRREIIKNNNLTFTIGTKYGEDGEFVWKYLVHCKKAINIDLKLYGYFVNEFSVTKKINKNRIQSLEAIKRVENYIEKNNFQYSKKFNMFAYNRTLLAVLKTFATKESLELYKNLLEHDQIRRRVITLILYPNMLVKLASIVFFISPKLFYGIMVLVNKK